MEFGSIEFLLYFLPVFFLFYAITPKRLKNAMLLAGSYVFYAQGTLSHGLVLVISILVNYGVGRLLDQGGKPDASQQQGDFGEKRDKKRELLFMVAVMGNLAVLCHFKIWAEAIPLGLSFYTFQVLGYLADVHYGEVRAERSLTRFALYLGMFPKVCSGPITSYAELKDQLANREITIAKVQDGLRLFVLGLAFKTLLADRIGILWTEVEKTGYASVSWRYAWLGAFGYSLMLYFDFQGYSMMAIGLGKMTGFDLPENFDKPYLARSVREFYRRWHITMGTWFRKYVYFHLGGNRKGEGRTVLNLLVVWLLTGFWHGISPNFFMWGVFLWSLIVAERLIERIPIVKQLILWPRLYLWFVIPISWMFFAITDVQDLQAYLMRMFGMGHGINVYYGDWLVCLKRHGAYLIAGVICATGVVETIFEKLHNKFLSNLILAILFWICVWKIMAAGSNPFAYVSF